MRFALNRESGDALNPDVDAVVDAAIDKARIAAEQGHGIGGKR
jgi:hypothetical protein